MLQHKFVWACLCSGIALGSTLVTPACAEAAQASAQADARRTEAVQLARQNHYAEALAICQQLAEEGDVDVSFWADYLTILSWAGQQEKMTALAEQQFGQNVMSLSTYALLPLAQAYSAEGAIGKAETIYDGLVQRAKAAGDEAQLAQIAQSRAQAAMNRKDYVEAEAHYREVKQARPQEVRDMDAERAARYVQQGEAGRAVRILRPYVIAKTATSHMFSDYLMALRFDNQPKLAKKDFQTYVQDWADIPAYGLQTIGDIYLRSHDYKQAHKIYHYIEQREKAPQSYVELGDAYALAMLGHEKNALTLYQKVLTDNKYSPRMQNIIASDGDVYLRSGRLFFGGRVYKLLGKDAVEKEQYQLRHGLTLVNINRDLHSPQMNFQRDAVMAGRDYSLTAKKVLQPLTNSKNESVRLQASAGLAQNALERGLYATADQKIAKLQAWDNDNPAVLQVSSQQEGRQEHDFSAYYANRIDNKRNHESNAGFDTSNYLGQNVYLNAGMSHNRLQDGRLRASYNQENLGATWNFAQGSVGAAYQYFGDEWRDGYQAFLNYDINDLSSLNLTVGRRPHDAAGAVKRHITEEYRSVRWDFLPHYRWQFSTGYEWADLSDGNDDWNLDISGHYFLTQKHNFVDTIPFSFNRGHYDQRAEEYDSPYRSIYYGLGWSRLWNLPRHDCQWRWTNMLNWGHDDDERMGLSPYTRLEYRKSLPQNQQLTAAAQYNWYFHQEPNADWQRRNNGYLFELNYEIGW